MMKHNARSVLHTVSTFALATAAACATVPPAGQVQPPSSQPAEELEMFRVVIEFLPSVMEGLELRVDARPMKSDPAIWLRRLDNLTGTDSMTAERTAVLRARGVPGIDYFHDDTCSGGGGYPPPPPYESVRQGPHTCGILALSRPGGIHFPPGDVDDRASADSSTHRTIRVLLTSPGRYSTVDVVLRRVDGTWTLVDHRFLREVVS